MKVVTASNGKKALKISKREWQAIGKTAGWIKSAKIKKTASVDVYVKDLNYDSKNLEDIHDVAYYILSNVFHPYFQKNNIQESKDIPFYERIVPDMSSSRRMEQEGIGIMNFYTVDLNQNQIKDLIEGTKNSLDQLGIQITKMKNEKSGVYNSNVIRIHIDKTSHTIDQPKPINLGNIRALKIFKDVLGYQDFTKEVFIKENLDFNDLFQNIELSRKNEMEHIDDLAEKTNAMNLPYTLDIDDLMNRINRFYKNNPNQQNAFETETKRHTPRFIEQGIDLNYIHMRLSEIYKLCVWAKEKGYKELIVSW